MEDLEIQQIAEIISFGKRMTEHMSPNDVDTYKKELLQEMAYERKIFKAIITNLSQQIIKNWCLIHYGRLTNIDEGLINHWKTELTDHLTNAASNKIKKSNTTISRKKAIREVWFDEKEYGLDTNVINLTIYGKFKKENLNTKSKEYKKTIQDCKTASNSIIEVIASGNTDIIKQYINSL